MGIPSQFRPEWALKMDRNEAIPTAIRDGCWIGEAALVSRDGREIPVSQVILAHKSPSGDVDYISTIARDITQEKRLKEQLLQSQKMEAIGRLAGGVAHDFNNMLTVILGHSVLLTDANIGPEFHASVVAIKHAAERAASLTSRLLAFGRKQILLPRVLHLNDVVTRMKDVLASFAGEHVELCTSLWPGLGQVKADPAQIEQILVNLVLNSHDAMPKAGKILIETSNEDLDAGHREGRWTVPPGRYVVVAVQDNGCGVDSQTMAHLFEPFFTTKPFGEAAGLGLATTYGIVQQSSGHITVCSEPGIGTTFRIYLPRIDTPAPGGIQETRVAPAEAE
jgi:signal transduction histidine kinase